MKRNLTYKKEKKEVTECNKYDCDQWNSCQPFRYGFQFLSFHSVVPGTEGQEVNNFEPSVASNFKGTPIIRAVCTHGMT